MTEQPPDHMSEPAEEIYLATMTEEDDSVLGAWFAKHGVDGRNSKTNTLAPTTRTGGPMPAPKTSRPGTAPVEGEPHLIHANPDEIHELIHLLAQLHTTDPDPKE